jgi:4-hydroxy-tetrahydrodipicolinate synthase
MEWQHVQFCSQEKGRRSPAAGSGPIDHPSWQDAGSRGNGQPGANAGHRNPTRTAGSMVWSAKFAVETGMTTKMLTGSFVALITPFNRDGSVDFAAFRTLLKFQEDQGTSAVLIMGSTGETSMLSPEEKKQIIVETAKMKTGRMPIFFGCTGNNTETTVANVRFARDNGADGAILAAPAYICAPESDIERFFLDVADATDLPLGIYNNPPRVKSDLHWDHLLRIFKHPNYVVHKESTARVGQVAQVLADKPSVSVMCCDSPNLGLVVPTMSLGGHGTNMTGNVAPAELATISTPWASYVEAENFKTAYLKLLPLLHFTYSAINPVAVKSLMKVLGMPSGDLRKPLSNLDGEALAKGIRIVKELGLDQQYGYKVAPISAVAA